MNRRDFVKFGLMAMIFKGGLLTRDLPAAEAPLLSVAEGKDFEAVTRSVIAALGGMGKFVKTGDTVVVKPNIGWDRRPEYAANTHPLVVKAVCEEAVRVGAKKVKVFDHTCNDPRRCYENSGIQKAVAGMKNVEMKQIEKDRFRKVKLNGTFLKEWEIYDEVLSANVLINVPIAKHHGLTGLSLGLKNMMGVMGGNRGYIHRQIEDALADLNSVVKSHLTVIDATRILLNHGPQGGSLKDVKVLNKVIASADIVAADAYATTLFGMSPSEISSTVAAGKRKLGEMNLGRIRVLKV